MKHRRESTGQALACTASWFLRPSTVRNRSPPATIRTRIGAGSRPGHVRQPRPARLRSEKPLGRANGRKKSAARVEGTRAAVTFGPDLTLFHASGSRTVSSSFSCCSRSSASLLRTTVRSTGARAADLHRHLLANHLRHAAGHRVGDLLGHAMLALDGLGVVHRLADRVGNLLEALLRNHVAALVRHLRRSCTLAPCGRPGRCRSSRAFSGTMWQTCRCRSSRVSGTMWQTV